MNLHNSFYMKIIGCMQVGGDCSWILNSSLTNMSKIVDEIVLVGGDVSDKSKQIINQCNNVVDTDFYSNNRSRIEWNDLNSLLQMAKKHKADCTPLDKYFSPGIDWIDPNTVYLLLTLSIASTS